MRVLIKAYLQGFGRCPETTTRNVIDSPAVDFKFDLRLRGMLGAANNALVMAIDVNFVTRGRLVCSGSVRLRGGCDGLGS